MSNSITVIIPTYNSTKYIGKVINSIIGQSVKPNKIVLVDDNSDDYKSLNIIVSKIKKESFENIKLIASKNSQGPGSNRNLAWSKCNTDLLAFCDDDDYWYRDKLKQQLKIFKKNKNIKLVASKKKMMNHLFKDKNLNKEIKLSKLFFYKLLFKNYIPTSSVVIKSNLKNRFLNEYYAEDYFLWLSILKENHECYFINDYLCEELKISKKIKLSNDFIKINKGAQNVLSQFYSRNLINNLLVTLAKVYYYFKMIIKTIIYIK